MISLFFEPSTRTRLSHEMAMVKLGGQVISTENARDFSSASKGEDLPDTIKVISGYGPDVIVLRHYQEGAAKRAQSCTNIPIINAGDGRGQHPTQALLDLYTIRQEFVQIKGLTIAMVGDLANGRTVRSLCYFLGKRFPDNRIILVSPVQTRMRSDILKFLHKHEVAFSETTDLSEKLPEMDVIYQTRVQKERFKGGESYQEVLGASEKLGITPAVLARMKPKPIIMHPLPRLTEVAREVDQDRRAAFFRQAQNGLFVRMALLKMIIVGY